MFVNISPKVASVLLRYSKFYTLKIYTNCQIKSQFGSSPKMAFINQDLFNTFAGKYKSPTKHIAYGTAGFRDKADLLDPVLFRIGMLAVIRSKLKGGVIGIMITASHNPEEDNGLKLIDPSGENLEQQWESVATKIVNVSESELKHSIEELISSNPVDAAYPAHVFIGYDTRPSSERLAEAAKNGVKALGGEITDFGLLTTPQLHFIVRCHNSKGLYGDPTELGYYMKLSSAFVYFRNQCSAQANYLPHLLLDGANGVGALKVKKLMEFIGEYLILEVYNDGNGKLNHKCGADYVKIHQQAPEGIPLMPGARYVSLDGDADRIIYFYIDNNGRFHMLDGDKIATLIASYLQTLLQATGLNLRFSLVQTAYANGSSTDYISNMLKVPVACVPTGVKYLHHEAKQADIGVYFEANGHGTVVFSEEAQRRIFERAESEGDEEKVESAKRLQQMINLINQTVGDAISDLLVVETILHQMGWSIEEWDMQYTDLPNKQMKIKVSDRKVITTTDNERISVTPPGLQDEINKLVSKCTKGRAFVRPSGTEDIVRVYAEAATEDEATNLAYEVAVKVFSMAGGVGTLPPKPS